MNLTVSPTSAICPVCSSACEDLPLYNYTAKQAAAHFCPITRDADRHHRLEAAIRKLWQGKECSVLRCNDCGFAFGYPFVGGDEEFYSILHEQKGYPVWRWEYDVAINGVLNSTGGGKILDIGAGVGMFLCSLGKEWEGYAVEGSESTRKILEASGIKVFRDLSSSTEKQAGTFQVITIFQVLEHIAEFHEVIAQCRQLLSAGGKLVISVPDGEAMIRQERLTGCPDMPPNHINKFTADSLSRVLKDADFETAPAIFEPFSWFNFKGALHLRVIADSTNPNSVAAQVYRIPNKRLRTPLLAGLGMLAMLRMLPHLGQLSQGGAFTMVGIAK
jgi:SAM-dependent methyltransferase